MEINNKINKYFKFIIKDIEIGMMTTTEALKKYDISKTLFYKNITPHQKRLLNEAQTSKTIYGVGYYK